jgi:dienelactone hydrolase
MMTRVRLSLWLALVFAFMPMGVQAQNVVRMEIVPIETVTLKTQQFLTGDLNGKPTVIAGELRIPKPGSDKLPAVVLVHGSGGVGGSTDRWAQELNSIGVAAFILDSFSGRGIVNTGSDQSQLDSVAMMVDAYRVLARLAGHPRVDPNRIAVMGFSKGAVAAVYSSNERFRKLYAGNESFAAHIGLYTPCNTTYRDDSKTTGKPIRLFHGIADDYVSIGPCRIYAERLKGAGADATLTEYPDAHHAYDVFLLKESVWLPQAQTGRNCLVKEGDDGKFLDAKTGNPFNPAAPCTERGAHIGYNPAAHQATVKAVKEFLTATFKLE